MHLASDLSCWTSLQVDLVNWCPDLQQNESHHIWEACPTLEFMILSALPSIWSLIGLLSLHCPRPAYIVYGLSPISLQTPWEECCVASPAGPRVTHSWSSVHKGWVNNVPSQWQNSRSFLCCLLSRSQRLLSSISHTICKTTEVEQIPLGSTEFWDEGSWWLERVFHFTPLCILYFPSNFSVGYSWCYMNMGCFKLKD